MRDCFCVVSIGLCLLASADAFGAGSTAASFLRIAVGAKNIAMGETGVTEKDANAAYWNPAGLTGLEGRSISLMHTVWLEDVTLQNATYAHKIGNGALAVSGTYLAVPEIMKYDNTGLSENTTFRPSDTALGISYASRVRNVPLGVSLKYITSQIDGKTASAVAADVGLLLKPATMGGRGLQAGISLQNIGSSMKFLNDAEPLPFNIKVGAMYTFSESFAAALDINKAIDIDPTANAGLQYQHYFEERLYVAVRGGYRTNVKGLGGMAGLTSGLGIGYRGIAIDYALVPYGDLSDTHRLSLCYNF